MERWHALFEIQFLNDHGLDAAQSAGPRVFTSGELQFRNGRLTQEVTRTGFVNGTPSERSRSRWRTLRVSVTGHSDSANFG
jgi:hypothetical protein